MKIRKQHKMRYFVVFFRVAFGQSSFAFGNCTSCGTQYVGKESTEKQLLEQNKKHGATSVCITGINEIPYSDYKDYLEKESI